MRISLALYITANIKIQTLNALKKRMKRNLVKMCKYTYSDITRTRSDGSIARFKVETCSR